MTETQVINIAPNQAALDEYLNPRLATLSLFSQHYASSKEELAKKISLVVMPHQAIFNSDNLEKQTNNINTTLKRRLKDKDLHFLYRDLLELQKAEKSQFGAHVKVYDPAAKEFLQKYSLFNLSSNSYLTQALSEIVPYSFLAQIDDKSILKLYRIYFNQFHKLEIFTESGLGTLAELLDFCQEKGQTFENLYNDISNELNYQIDLLHRHNICHRDIGPHNIIVTKDYKFKLANYINCLKFPTKGKQKINCVGSPSYISEEMLEAFDNGGFVELCPFEEDKKALDRTLKDIKEKLKRCEKKVQRILLLQNFEIDMMLKLYGSIEEKSLQDLVIKDLENELWTEKDINEESSKKKKTDELIKLELLLNERHGKIAFDQNDYKTALIIFANIASILQKKEVQDYRGWALVKGCEIQKRLKDFLRSHVYIKYQGRYMVLVRKDSSLYKQCVYLKTIVAFYSKDFDTFIEEIRFKRGTLTEIFREKIEQVCTDIEKHEDTIRKEVDFMIFFYIYKHKLITPENLNHLSAKSVLIYYTQLVELNYQLYDETENIKDVLSAVRAIKSLDPEYIEITEYKMIELFERTKYALEKNVAKFAHLIKVCEANILMIKAQMHGMYESNRDLYDALIAVGKDTSLFISGEVSTKDFTKAMICVAPPDKKISYQMKFLKLIFDKFEFFDALIEFLEYHEFTGNNGAGEKLRKIFLEKTSFEHSEAFRYEAYLLTHFRNLEKDELKRAVLFYFENIHMGNILMSAQKIFFSNTNLIQLLNCYEQLHSDLGYELYKMVDEYQALCQKQPERSNSFFFTIISCFILLEKKDAKSIYEKLANFLNFQYTPKFGQNYFNPDNLFKTIQQTKSILYMEIFEYFNRSLSFPEISFKDFYLGVYYMNFYDFSRASASFCSFYNNYLKPLNNIDHPEILTYIEYIGEVIHYMYEQNHHGTNFNNAITTLKEILSGVNESKSQDPLYKDLLKGLIHFFLLNFEETHDFFIKHLTEIEKKKQINRQESILLYRMSCIMMLKNKRLDAENIYLKLRHSIDDIRAQEETSLYYWHRDFYIILELEKKVQNLILHFGHSYLIEQKHNVYIPTKRDNFRKKKHTLNSLRKELREIIVQIPDSSHKSFFIINKNTDKARVQSLIKCFKVSIEFLESSFHLSDYRVVELYYLKAFSRLDLFNNKYNRTYAKVMKEFTKDFNFAVDLHKKFCDEEDSCKSIDEFRTSILAHVERRELAQIKKLIANYAAHPDIWMNCPLAIVSLLDEWRNLYFISLIKSENSQKWAIKSKAIQSPLITGYIDFEHYNSSVIKDSLSLRIETERNILNKLFLENDDYEEEIGEQLKRMHLFLSYKNALYPEEEIENAPVPANDHISSAKKILSFHVDNADHSAELIVRYLALALFYQSGIPDEKVKQALRMLGNTLKLEKTYLKDKFRRHLISLEPRVEIFTFEGIFFDVKLTKKEKVIDFLTSHELFDNYRNDDEEFYNEYKLYDILYSKQTKILTLNNKEEGLVSNFNIIHTEELKKVLNLGYASFYEQDELMMGFFYHEAKNFSQSILEYINFLRYFKKRDSYSRTIFSGVCLHIMHLALKIEADSIAVSALRTCLKEISTLMSTKDLRSINDVDEEYYDIYSEEEDSIGEMETNRQFVKAFSSPIDVRIPIRQQQVATTDVTDNGNEEGSMMDGPVKGYFGNKIALLMKIRASLLLCKMGKHKDAIKFFPHDDIKNLEHGIDPLLLAKAYFEFGYHHAQIGDQKEMKEYFYKTIDSKSELFEYKNILLYVQAMVYIGKLEDALDYSTKVENTLQAERNYTEEKLILLSLHIILKFELEGVLQEEEHTRLINDLEANRTRLSPENVIACLTLYLYYKKAFAEDENDFSGKLIEILEDYFRTKIDIRKTTDRIHIPDAHLSKLRSLRLGEIYHKATSTKMSALEIVNFYQFLKLEWQRWNRLIFQFQLGIYNSFFQKDRYGDSKENFVIADISELDDVSELHDYILENSKYIPFVNEEEYMEETRKEIKFNGHEYIYLGEGPEEMLSPIEIREHSISAMSIITAQKENENEPSEPVETENQKLANDEDDEEEEKDFNSHEEVSLLNEHNSFDHLYFGKYFIKKLENDREYHVEFKVFFSGFYDNKERFVQELELLKNPSSKYCARLIDYTLEYKKMMAGREKVICRGVFEKPDFTLKDLVTERKKFLNRKDISGEKVIQYLKELIVAFVNCPVSLYSKKLRPEMIGIVDGHIKINFAHFMTKATSADRKNEFYDDDKEHNELKNYSKAELDLIFELDPFGIRMLYDTFVGLLIHDGKGNYQYENVVYDCLCKIDPFSKNNFLNIYNHPLIRRAEVIEDVPAEAKKNVAEYFLKREKLFFEVEGIKLENKILVKKSCCY